MKKNIGATDKIIRLIIAIILIVIYFSGIVEGTWAIIFPIAAIVLAITTITGFCGLYPLLGINTCKVKEKK
ncbi:MAG: DUF2892 domain-containing protein [Bacteroidia bacterium]|nr:MAG: DUF2892 domain-containing protein [Bacteroidia bacterium]